MINARYRLASVFWAILIILLLLSPSSGEKVIDIPHIDKVVHFGLFLIQGILVLMGWYQRKTMGSLILLTLTCVMLAGFTEYFQMYVPGRSADLADFLFDLLGIFSGFIVTNRIIIGY